MRIPPPHDSRCHVSVRLKGGKGQIRLPDVPHVDGEVDDQSRTANVFATLRTPFDLYFINHLTVNRDSLDQNIIHILVLVVLYRNESKILPQCMTISHKITIVKSLSVKEKIHKITCPTGPIV